MLSGTINGYIVTTEHNSLFVSVDPSIPTRRLIVDGLSDFVANAKDLKLGWGKFPDGDLGVVYLYDKADDKFGYAFNLDDPEMSEWGYAPFV